MNKLIIGFLICFNDDRGNYLPSVDSSCTLEGWSIKCVSESGRHSEMRVERIEE